jgi:hypothetical protein
MKVGFMSQPLFMRLSYVVLGIVVLCIGAIVATRSWTESQPGNREPDIRKPQAVKLTGSQGNMDAKGTPATISKKHEDLFSRQEITAPRTSQQSNQPWIRRSRLAILNMSALAPNKPIELNLFDDVRLTAIFGPSKKAGISGNEIWNGEIDGGGVITLVVTPDGVVVGSLTVPGKHSYEIAYVSGYTHTIREVDDSKRPVCNGPIVPNTRK